MALIRSIRGGSAGLNEEDRLKMANLHKANALCELVDNQPTAFDVEKVVADLEQLKLDGACECWDGDMGEEHAIDMAIEIVKRGGREEEQRKVCERDC